MQNFSAFDCDNYQDRRLSVIPAIRARIRVRYETDRSQLLRSPRKPNDEPLWKVSALLVSTIPRYTITLVDFMWNDPDSCSALRIYQSLWSFWVCPIYPFNQEVVENQLCFTVWFRRIYWSTWSRIAILSNIDWLRDIIAGNRMRRAKENLKGTAEQLTNDAVNFESTYVRNRNCMYRAGGCRKVGKKINSLHPSCSRLAEESSPESQTAQSAENLVHKD